MVVAKEASSVAACVGMEMAVAVVAAKVVKAAEAKAVEVDMAMAASAAAATVAAATRCAEGSRTCLDTPGLVA